VICLEKSIPMTLMQKRLLLLTISGILFFGLAYLFVLRRSGDHTVVFEDIREKLDKLTEEQPLTEDELLTLFDPEAPYTLVREPLSEEIAGIFHPGIKIPKGRVIYDPIAYCIVRPDMRLTRHFDEYPGGEFPVNSNNYGFRNDEDFIPGKPDLRILVTGDSHTEGVVPNHESFANVLGTLLRERQPLSLVDRVLECRRGGRLFIQPPWGD
ncbi:MAG: hypothetical protein KJ645_12480, partial [Planctomycetes bacterium]|nr:hypothetical protein [Planctomycetota bacterium]